MCGIAGYTGRWDSPTLARVEAALRHRGPDDFGSWVGDAISISNSRLAIIDIPGGRQPIFNEDRTAAIVFNGEIYNYRELRRRLEAAHTFQTDTDTEVILHLYEEVGSDVSSHLKGDFAFCIWDLVREECLLSRDHLGVKPLYYARTSGGGLAFSSELTALLGQPGVEAVVDPDAVVEYFTYLYIPAPRTLLRGVWKLQPGESLTWRDGEVRRWFYWTIPPVDDDLPSPDQFRRTVRDGVRTAVERRLIADVPVGAFLSGGVDSGLIVALASQAQPGLNTFTAGFGEPDFDELEPARQVSRMFGTSHHEFVITPDAQLLLEEVISAMDEPIADSSAIPTFMIARETARHVKVVLSGVGGDELFFGYPRYLGFRLSQDMPSPLGRLSTLASRWFRSKPSGRDLGGWIRRFGEGVAMDPSERYHFWTTFLSAPAADRLLRFDNRLTAPALDAEGAGSSDLLDAVFRADLQRYMSSGLLKFADGMTMANSLEVRVPFCDVDLVEAMSRVPAAVRFPGFRLKSVLREMASECLPRSLARRPKQGFMIPIGRWLRNELNSYVQAELSDQNLPPFLAPDGVRSLVREHLSGRQNHTHLVWAALVLVRWLRLHPEVNAESAVSAFPVAR